MPFFNPNPETSRGQQVETFKNIPEDEFEAGKKLFVWGGSGNIEEYEIVNDGSITNGNLEVEIRDQRGRTSVEIFTPDQRLKLARVELGNSVVDKQRGFEYEVDDTLLSKDGEEVEYELSQFQLDNNGNRANPGNPESRSHRVPEEVVLAMQDVFEKKEELEGLKREIESKGEAEIDNLLQTQSNLLDRVHSKIEDVFSSTGRIGENYSGLEQDLQSISNELENLKNEIQNAVEFSDSYDNYDHYYHELIGDEKEKNELRDELEESVSEAIESEVLDEVRSAYDEAKDWYDQHIDVANPNQGDINDYVAKISSYYDLIGKDSDIGVVRNIANNNPDQLQVPYYENQIEDLVTNQVGLDSQKYDGIKKSIYDNIYSNIENDSELEFLVENIKEQAREKIRRQNRIGNNLGPVSDVIEDNYEEFFNNALVEDYPENPNNKETFNFENERDELSSEYSDLLDEIDELINQSDLDVMINNAPGGTQKEQELQDLRDNIQDLRDGVSNGLDTIEQNWDDLLDLQSSSFNDFDDLKRGRFEAVKNTKAQLLKYKADFSELEIKLRTSEIQTEQREEEPNRETVEFDKETLESLIDIGAFQNGIRSILEAMAGNGDINNARNHFRNLFDPNQPPQNPEEFGIHNWSEFVQKWQSEMVGPAIEKFQMHCQQILQQEVSAAMDPDDSAVANGARVLSSVGSIWGGKALAGAGATAAGISGMAALPILAAGGGLGYIMRNEIADFFSGMKKNTEKKTWAGKLGGWFGDKAEEWGLVDREPEPIDKLMDQIQNDSFEQDTFIHLLNQTIQQQTASEREIEINGEAHTVSGANRNYYERDIKNLESDPENRDRMEALQLATVLDLNGDRMEEELVEQMQQNQQGGEQVQQQQNVGFMQKTGAAIDMWNKSKQGEYEGASGKLATFAVGSAVSAGYQAAFYASPNWAIVTGSMGAVSGAVSGWRGVERKALEKYSSKEKESAENTMRIFSDWLEMVHNGGNLENIASNEGVSHTELYDMYEQLVVAAASEGADSGITLYPDGKGPQIKGIIQELEKTEVIQRQKNVRELLQAIENKGREMQQELEERMGTWQKTKASGVAALKGAAIGLGLGAGIRGGVETVDWMSGGEFETDIYFSNANQEPSEGYVESNVDNPTIADSDPGTTSNQKSGSAASGVAGAVQGAKAGANGVIGATMGAQVGIDQANTPTGISPQIEQGIESHSAEYTSGEGDISNAKDLWESLEDNQQKELAELLKDNYSISADDKDDIFKEWMAKEGFEQLGAKNYEIDGVGKATVYTDMQHPGSSISFDIENNEVSLKVEGADDLDTDQYWWSPPGQSSIEPMPDELAERIDSGHGVTELEEDFGNWLDDDYYRGVASEQNDESEKAKDETEEQQEIKKEISESEQIPDTSAADQQGSPVKSNEAGSAYIDAESSRVSFDYYNVGGMSEAKIDMIQPMDQDGIAMTPEQKNFVLRGALNELENSGYGDSLEADVIRRELAGDSDYGISELSTDGADITSLDADNTEQNLQSAEESIDASIEGGGTESLHVDGIGDIEFSYNDNGEISGYSIDQESSILSNLSGDEAVDSVLDNPPESYDKALEINSKNLAIFREFSHKAPVGSIEQEYLQQQMRSSMEDIVDHPDVGYNQFDPDLLEELGMEDRLDNVESLPSQEGVERLTVADIVNADIPEQYKLSESVLEWSRENEPALFKNYMEGMNNIVSGTEDSTTQGETLQELKRMLENKYQRSVDSAQNVA